MQREATSGTPGFRPSSAKTNKKIAFKVSKIFEAVMRDPFDGIGKPEPLKPLDAGAWSRQPTQEHRIVYLVQDDRVDFLQARHHY